MKHGTTFSSLQQVKAAAAMSLQLTRSQIIKFEVKWYAITCLAHDDCSAGAIVYQDAPHSFFVVFVATAHSKSTKARKAVAEETLTKAMNDGHPYAFAIGGHDFYIKPKHYHFPSTLAQQDIHVYDVYADGQCGFRAIAVADLHEEDLDDRQHFYDKVRSQMALTLQSQLASYSEAIEDDVVRELVIGEMEKSLVLTHSIWDGMDDDDDTALRHENKELNTNVMMSLNLGQLAADPFARIFVTIEQNFASADATNVPKETWHLFVPQEYTDVLGSSIVVLLRSYQLDLAQNHYYSVLDNVDLTGKCTFGPLTKCFVDKMSVDAQQQISAFLAPTP